MLECLFFFEIMHFIIVYSNPNFRCTDVLYTIFYGDIPKNKQVEATFHLYRLGSVLLCYRETEESCWIEVEKQVTRMGLILFFRTRLGKN